MAPSSDPGAFFDATVRHRLGADVTLGNLEGTLATGGSSKCGAGSENCFAFRAPPSYARVLRKAGFTIVNVANNHALDYGEAGQAETLAAVKSAGLRHTGRPGEIAYLEQGRRPDRADRRRALRLGAGSPGYRRRRPARAQG